MRHGEKRTFVDIRTPVRAKSEYQEYPMTYSGWVQAWAKQTVKRGGEIANRQETQSFVYSTLEFSWSDVMDPHGDGKRIEANHVCFIDEIPHDIDYINTSDPLRRCVMVNVVQKRDPQ
jgi:hypothetical protein